MAEGVEQQRGLFRWPDDSGGWKTPQVSDSKKGPGIFQAKIPGHLESTRENGKLKPPLVSPRGVIGDTQ